MSSSSSQPVNLPIFQQFLEIKPSSISTIKQNLGQNISQYKLEINSLENAFDINSFIQSAKKLKISLSNQQSQNLVIIHYIDSLIDSTINTFLKQIPFECEFFNGFIQASVDAIIELLDKNPLKSKKLKSLKSISNLNVFIKSANKLKTSLTKSNHQEIISYIDSLIHYAINKFLKPIPFICETLNAFIQASIDALTELLDKNILNNKKFKSLTSSSDVNCFLNFVNELKASLLETPNEDVIFYIDSLIQHANSKFPSSTQQLSKPPEKNYSSATKIRSSSFNIKVIPTPSYKTNLSKDKKEIKSQFQPVTTPTEFSPINEEINQFSSIDQQIFFELDDLNINYTPETKNSVLLKFVQIFKTLILSTIPKNETKIEIEDFRQIILNLTLSKSYQQIKQLLQPYFGEETGTDEEIIKKYDEKFKILEKNLLTIQQYLFSQSPQSSSYILSIDEISQHFYTEVQAFPQP
jgi:hypothetical protein